MLFFIIYILVERVKNCFTCFVTVSLLRGNLFGDHGTVESEPDSEWIIARRNQKRDLHFSNNITRKYKCASLTSHASL